ncbi:MAG: regulatory protein RecX [Blastocatellia bacterium]
MTNELGRLHDSDMTKTPYERTFERALRLLAYKPRTVAEMRVRLLEKDWAEESVVDQVVARLEELGYLNDEEFAANFANSRLTAKPIGRTRLRRDLQRKKLPAQVVEQSLNEAYEQQSEEELIERAIKKRLRLKGAPETREEAKKLFDYLMRRGFSYDLIVRKVREAGKDVDASDEIE